MNSESTMKSEGIRLRSNNVQRDPTNNSNSSSSQNQQISPEDGNLHTQNQNSANINGFAYYQENHPTYLPYAMAYYQ
jgi:hypothetical protein